MYVGLMLLVSGSIWDAINARRAPSCEIICAPEAAKAPDVKRRAATGAALSVAAAGAFYALYKSVDVMTPAAAKADIACWGINSCKGQTACSTALNACTGQNTCKGRGYLNVSVQQCKAQGGQPLKGSPACTASVAPAQSHSASPLPPVRGFPALRVPYGRVRLPSPLQPSLEGFLSVSLLSPHAAETAMDLPGS